jgi:hypothetical protein
MTRVAVKALSVVALCVVSAFVWFGLVLIALALT